MGTDRNPLFGIGKANRPIDLCQEYFHSAANCQAKPSPLLQQNPPRTSLMTHHATARSPRPSIQAIADKAISHLTKSIIRANDITLAGIPKKRRDICCLDGKRTRGDHGSENLTHFRESLISWLVFPWFVQTAAHLSCGIEVLGNTYRPKRLDLAACSRRVVAF